VACALLLLLQVESFRLGLGQGCSIISCSTRCLAHAVAGACLVKSRYTAVVYTRVLLNADCCCCGVRVAWLTWLFLLFPAAGVLTWTAMA
jgi:hypothetical protein